MLQWFPPSCCGAWILLHLHLRDRCALAALYIPISDMLKWTWSEGGAGGHAGRFRVNFCVVYLCEVERTTRAVG